MCAVQKSIKILTTSNRAHMLLLSLVVRRETLFRKITLTSCSAPLEGLFLVKIADGQFRCLLICLAGGQHFLSYGYS